MIELKDITGKAANQFRRCFIRHMRYSVYHNQRSVITSQCADTAQVIITAFSRHTTTAFHLQPSNLSCQCTIDLCRTQHKIFFCDIGSCCIIFQLHFSFPTEGKNHRFIVFILIFRNQCNYNIRSFFYKLLH